MKYITTLTIITILLVFNATAQTTQPLNSFLQFTGSIDKESSLTMNLVRVGDSLYGDYSCIAAGKVMKTDYRYKGDSRQVFGKITGKGNFWIKEWPGSEGPVFRGQFTDNQNLRGTWSPNARSGIKLSFVLTEKNNTGNLRFNPYIVRDHKNLVKDEKSPRAKINMILLALSKETISKGFDTVQRILLTKFSGDDNKNGDPEKLLAEIRKDYFTNYIQDNETLYKEMPGASFGWELIRSTHIIYNDHDKLCFYILSYSFTGGAHGQQSQVFTCVDLKKKRIITLQDIFIQGFEAELDRLLTKKLHTMSNLPESAKLSESGYFTDEINHNDNFYLNGNGIGFFYNQYEIAPYSFGATEIFLTTEELRPILK